MTMRIAILGWGSLLWDADAEFDQHHHNWQLNGPTLNLEFSRKSARREGALTLVIDGKNGSACSVAFCMSKRNSVEEAITDLASRENTPKKNIGFLASDGSRHGRDEEAIAAIAKWAGNNSVESVVWTDLSSNFDEFSIQTALIYVQSLPPGGIAKAKEYVRCARSFVKTPLRAALEASPWFAV